jgi:CheY-like chemotaxis protein
LIIDDNTTNLRVIAGYLEEFGLKILIAQTGENGCGKAQLAHPDLILFDVVLPGIDGFETYRRLKENETTKNIPVIFMTVLTQRSSG